MIGGCGKLENKAYVPPSLWLIFHFSIIKKGNERDCADVSSILELIQHVFAVINTFTN